MNLKPVTLNLNISKYGVIGSILETKAQVRVRRFTNKVTDHWIIP